LEICSIAFGWSPAGSKGSLIRKGWFLLILYALIQNSRLLVTF
jgi:hypothetical protein